MDLAELANAPIEVTLSGRTFQARALTLAEWGELQAWIKVKSPSPLERAARTIEAARERGAPLGDYVQDVLIENAMRLSASWPPRIGTVGWLQTIDDIEGGIAEFAWHALKPLNAITRDEVAEIAGTVDAAELQALTSVAILGRKPDPKSPGPIETETAEPIGPNLSGTSGQRSTAPSSSTVD